MSQPRESASRPRRRAPSTSAARARHSTTGLPPAARAARWCCGSRTPTASARPRRTSSRSSTRCEWLELDWDEGPLSQSERARAPPRARSPSWSRRARAYPDPATAEDVKAWKAEHGNGGYRGEPRDEPGAAIRLRVPDEGETVVDDLIRGPVQLREPAQGRPRDRARRRHAALQLRGRRRRRRDGDHRCDPRRRPPLEHAEAAAGPRGARRRAAALRAPPAAARPRRQEALEAPRRRLRPGAARRPATCRRRSATTSRCSAGAPTTTRRSSRPTSWSSASIERVGQASAIFDEQKLRWMNGRYMRELPLDEYAEAVAARPRSRGPRASRRRPRARCAPRARSPRTRRRRSTRSGR